MRCKHCCEKIEKEDSFYEVDGDFYCEDCVQEETVTYYIIGGERETGEDEVYLFDNLKQYSAYVSGEIEYLKERMKKIEITDKEEKRKKYILEIHKERLEKLNNILHRIQSEEEEE